MLSEIQPDVASTPEEKAVLTPETSDVSPQSTEGEPASAEKSERDDRTVPLAALHEERQARKQLKAEVLAIREQQERQAQEYQLAQQRLAQLYQAAQPQPQVPDRETDPLGYTAHAVEQTQAQVNALARQQYEREQGEMQQRRQQMQVAEQQQQMAKAHQRIAEATQTFAQEKPDFNDAVRYAMEVQGKQYALLGHPPEVVQRMIDRDAWTVGLTALSRDENPADVMYRLAQAMGYQSRAVDAGQKMEMQEAGHRAAKASGGASKGRMSAQQIANMSATDLARMSDEEFRAVMGG